MRYVAYVAVVFLVLLALCTSIAHGTVTHDTRTLHTRCLYAPTSNGVAETRCTVTLPATVRVRRGGVLLVETGGRP